MGVTTGGVITRRRGVCEQILIQFCRRYRKHASKRPGGVHKNRLEKGARGGYNVPGANSQNKIGNGAPRGEYGKMFESMS